MRGDAPIYTAADMDAAEAVLPEFSDSEPGREYPAAVSVWERAWDQFIPFLEFAPIRKVIYTTDRVIQPADAENHQDSRPFPER